MEMDGNKSSMDLKKDARHTDMKRPSGKTIQNRNDQKSGAEKPASSLCNREVSHLENLIRSVPNTRKALVERIRRDFHNGNYSVKAEKIAEKILKDNLADEISQAQLDPSHPKK
ncbi:MAG: flagellar biosynthesis anti-sigma factor FlgM [Acidobacteriota bacterium]|jgi:anti-sigma28 factor (negative regulator of flagellin synthesis)